MSSIRSKCAICASVPRLMLVAACSSPGPPSYADYRFDSLRELAKVVEEAK